jgi:hypothetical protein
MVGRHRLRNRFRLEFVDPQLERRELLDASGLTLTPAEVAAAVASSQGTDDSVTSTELAAAAATSGTSTFFNQNGVKPGKNGGLVFSSQFKNQLNSRLRISADQAADVNALFKAFATTYSQLTIKPPPPPGSPTLSGLLTSLTNDIDFVLSHHVKPAQLARLSALQLLPGSSLQMQSLVPFANIQLAQLGKLLAATPPVPGPNGSMVPANPIPTINIADNAILNAIAEQSIHPNLFSTPGTFYLNPTVYFTVDFKGAPAKATIGYFVYGPGGVLLPGAPVPPNTPTVI